MNDVKALNAFSVPAGDEDAIPIELEEKKDQITSGGADISIGRIITVHSAVDFATGNAIISIFLIYNGDGKMYRADWHGYDDEIIFVQLPDETVKFLNDRGIE